MMLEALTKSPMFSSMLSVQPETSPHARSVIRREARQRKQKLTAIAKGTLPLRHALMELMEVPVILIDGWKEFSQLQRDGMSLHA